MAVDREFALFCLCVYSFVICWFPLVVFGAHFALLGSTLGLLLGAFGAPRAPRGLSLASLWPPFGSLGTPWDHLGHLGLPSGAWADFGSKTDVLFRANGLQVARLRTKSCLGAFSAASCRELPRAPYSHKVAQEPQLPTPLHSRRGLG